jgi:hypothetical protein
LELLPKNSIGGKEHEGSLQQLNYKVQSHCDVGHIQAVGPGCDYRSPQTSSEPCYLAGVISLGNSV